MNSLPVGADGTLDPALLEMLHAEMSVDRVPGAAIGVFHRGTCASAGLGVTNVEQPTKVTGSTLFQIGSVTKTFTVTALLQLVAEGKVRLDDPLKAHLPEFRVSDPVTSAEATVRDCMTHSCGWEGELFENTGSGDDALQRVIERMATLEQKTPRGKMWGYNNAAFYPLGRLIEVLDGQSYEASIKARILEPLGMSEASFFAEEIMQTSFAVGHDLVGDEVVVVRPWAMPRSSNPVGGLIASVEHLMRYAEFQLHGAPTLLSDEFRVASHEPAGPTEDEPSVGLGWWFDERPQGRIVYHGGGANGQPCYFAMLPAEDFAIAVLTNGAAGGTTARRTVDWAMGHYFGVTASPMPAHDSAASLASLTEGAGDYETLLDRWTIRVDGAKPRLEYTVLGDWLDGLYPETSPQPYVTPIAPLDNDRFIVDPGERSETIAEFHRDTSGEIRWLRYHLRTARKRDE